MNGNTTLRLRTRLPLLWLAALLLVALLLPSRIWNTLLIGLGGLFVVAYWWARALSRGLAGERRLRFGWVAVGDRLSEQFTLRNHSAVPAFWVEVMDESNVPGYRPGIVRSIGYRATDRWKQDAICQQRGQFHLGPWALRCTDPFGLFEATVSYPASDEIVIHPPIHTELPIPLPAGRSSGRSRAHRRHWQATTNSASVRDYRPRDPYRWIHWRTSARKDALFVREFDLDVSGDIWLLLDLQAAVQLGTGMDGTEEHAVLLAASLATRALHENRSVGLAVYGDTPRRILPGRGQGQQWNILRTLALARADGTLPLGRALHDLGQSARRGATVVVITASGSAEWLPELLQLARQGLPANAVLLDRPSFGGEGNSQGLCDAIRQLGANCYVIEQGDVGRPAGEGERRGFWEFKTLATGKVIVTKRPEQ